MISAPVIARQVKSPFCLVVVVMVAALVGTDTANATDLVLHLPLDDGAGSAIAVDVSGNGHDGTLVNMDPNTDWVSGRTGLALDFDGTNDYVSVPDVPALVPECTIARGATLEGCNVHHRTIVTATSSVSTKHYVLVDRRPVRCPAD